MDRLFTLVNNFDGGLALPLALMAAAVVVGSIAVWTTVRERILIRRRAQTVGSLDPSFAQGAEAAGRSPHEMGRRAAARVLSYVADNFVPDDKALVAKLRRQLMQAGFLRPSAVGVFFLARGVGAVVLGIGAAVGLNLFLPHLQGPKFYGALGFAILLGYMLPSLWLDKRIKRLAEEHRYGFPDFMDLMVVCADSGLAMESALERVGRELAQTHPSLAANLTMATLEMRAGRTLGEALEHLGDRLGIDEARSFATLLQQSEELGSSMTEALRVYSDDMRHQRLMRAEEKAYALPAKLVIPLGVFIFPIVMVVALLPIVIRLKFGLMAGG